MLSGGTSFCGVGYFAWWSLSILKSTRRSRIAHARVNRRCGTLLAMGFLTRMPSSQYRLGPKLLALGKTCETSNTVVAVSRVVMKTLARQTGESVDLPLSMSHFPRDYKLGTVPLAGYRVPSCREMLFSIGREFPDFGPTVQALAMDILAGPMKHPGQPRLSCED